MFFGDICPPWFSRYLSELRLTRSFRPCGELRQLHRWRVRGISHLVFRHWFMMGGR